MEGAYIKKDVFFLKLEDHISATWKNCKKLILKLMILVGLLEMKNIDY